MTIAQWSLGRGLLVAAAVAGAALAFPRSSIAAHPTGYSVHNLVADTDGMAEVTDARLVNPWGIAFSPGNPFWISDNHSGLSTLYNESGAIQGLTVTIPPPVGTDTASPTGVVFNGTSDFHGDHFIFASEDGIISGWAAGNNAVSRVDHSAAGAIYKGIAIGKSKRKNFLYLANFHDNKIEVYDSQYQPATMSGTFTDPHEPAGYAPFNVAVVGTHLLVSYAKQDQDAEDDVAGAGNGFIDEYALTGKFMKRLISGTSVGGRVSQLNSPWGMTIASAHFGKFKKALLVGNFGSGQIAAFNVSSGKLLGLISDAQGHALTIDGVWALTPGGGGSSGDPNKIYFTAGPGGETHGLFGSITANP